MEELVLDCVMPYIQDNHVLNSVSLVSRKYFDVDSLTRKHVTVHVHFLPNPERLTHRFPNLESLTLKSYSHGYETADKCTISVTPWIKIAAKFERLNSLAIRNMVVAPCDLKRLAKTRGASLRSLEIRGCKMVSEDGLMYIARYCRDLRSLRLDCNEIDGLANGKWFHKLALHNTVMESLDFHCPFDMYDMKDVTRLAKKCSNSLVSLKTFPKYLTDFRKVFKHAKKLHHFGTGVMDRDLDYSGFQFPPNICGLRIQHLRTASFPFPFPYLNQLRELDLYVGDLKPKCQCYFFKWCPSLEVLYTDDICGDTGFKLIGKFCKNLRKLTHNGGVTHSGLEAVAQGCPDLDYLEVYPFKISNKALACVGTHLTKLRDFRIWLRNMLVGARKLDNGVRAMLMGCSKLERLDISLCLGGLTDMGLRYIGEYGHNLRHLSLGYTGESDVGLLELSKGCPKLRKLKLEACPFSYQAITTFMFNNNHTLRYIRVESDSRVDLVLTRPMVSAEIEDESSPVLAPKANNGSSKRNNALKDEPVDNSPSKAAATAGAARGTATSKSSKGKRKSGDDAKTANVAAPSKKVKTENEVKAVKEEPGSGAKNGNGASSSKPASATGPVTQDEIRAVLLHKEPVTTQDLVAMFKSRLRTKEDKSAFADILSKISKIQKTNGPSYVVLRD